jgi:serine/threonine protein kinase
MSATGPFLGKYKLDPSLGKGATGEVFLAHHLLLDKQVAVKLVPEASAGQRLECDLATYGGLKGSTTLTYFRADKRDVGPAFKWDRLSL